MKNFLKILIFLTLLKKDNKELIIILKIKDLNMIKEMISI